MKRFARCILAVIVIVSGCSRGGSVGGATLVVHAGAGTIRREDMTPERDAQIRAALTQALTAGYDVLDSGGASLDAVEAAVRVLEDSPLFNAGKGSVFTNQGKNEMDASIMDGATLKGGAVASVTTIKNPITAARAVMDRTRHVLLVGRGAEVFAAEHGIETVDPEYFFTQHRWEALLKAKDKDAGSMFRSGKTGGQVRAQGKGDGKFGTAAAIALDQSGNLAAATSTGGLTNKLYGRVGDSPILGAGTYANNATCAVSATGQGEYFIRGVLCHEVSALMAYQGRSVEEAANTVIHERLTGMGGLGGVIALDARGNVAMPFNTEGMYRGYIRGDGTPHVFIYGDEE